jgi:hypothetical protein
VPFDPSVSWSSLCLPKKFSGATLVDIEDQSLALHLVYLQRLLCSPFSAADFVSPWLVHVIQMYTGHSSILPWRTLPAKYKSLLKPIHYGEKLCGVCTFFAEIWYLSYLYIFFKLENVQTLHIWITKNRLQKD